MSTRSAIGYVTFDKQVKHTYCHFDGYEEGIGFQLITNFNDDVKARDLVDKSTGGIRQISGGSAEYYELGTMTYTDTDLKKVIDDHKKDKIQEYLYIWDGHMWNCWGHKGRKIKLYMMESYVQFMKKQKELWSNVICPPLS